MSESAGSTWHAAKLVGAAQWEGHVHWVENHRNLVSHHQGSIYFLELHFLEWFCLTRDLMLLIFSNGAKERLSFVPKFSARGQMLTSDRHARGGKGLLGERMCVWEESKFTTAWRWLREWGKREWWGKCCFTFLWNFSIVFIHRFIFSLKELNPIPIIWSSRYKVLLNDWLFIFDTKEKRSSSLRSMKSWVLIN